MQGAVRGMQLSNPIAGHFDITSPQLKCKEHKTFSNMPDVTMFCIPVARVPDLIKGEEERALCTLVSDGKKKQKLGASYLCRCGKLRKAADQEREGVLDLGLTGALPACTCAVAWSAEL